jgi:hypothetical protein
MNGIPYRKANQQPVASKNDEATAIAEYYSTKELKN